MVQEPIHVVERAPILLPREAAPRVRDRPHLAKLVRTWFAYVSVKKNKKIIPIYQILVCKMVFQSKHDARFFILTI